MAPSGHHRPHRSSARCSSRRSPSPPLPPRDRQAPSHRAHDCRCAEEPRLCIRFRPCLVLPELRRLAHPADAALEHARCSSPRARHSPHRPQGTRALHRQLPLGSVRHGRVLALRVRRVHTAQVRGRRRRQAHHRRLQRDRVLSHRRGRARPTSPPRPPRSLRPRGQADVASLPRLLHRGLRVPHDQPRARPRPEPDLGAHHRRHLAGGDGHPRHVRRPHPALALAHRLRRRVAQLDRDRCRLVFCRRQHLAAPALHASPAEDHGPRRLRLPRRRPQSAQGHEQDHPQHAWLDGQLPWSLALHQGRLRRSRWATRRHVLQRDGGRGVVRLGTARQAAPAPHRRLAHRRRSSAPPSPSIASSRRRDRLGSLHRREHRSALPQPLLRPLRPHGRPRPRPARSRLGRSRPDRQ